MDTEKWVLDLQTFAGASDEDTPDDESLVVDDEDDVEETETDDVKDTGAEDEDESTETKDAVSKGGNSSKDTKTTETEDDEPEVAPYSETEKLDPTLDTSQVTFTAEQRAAINGIVARRVSRLERVQAEKLQDAAGIEVSQEEIQNAMALWGFLKANPDVSTLVDDAIKGYAAENETVEPREARKSSTLALKEAVLNLRLEDGVFNSFYSDVLDWAKDEGFSITTEKDLRLAYKAWRADKYVVKKAADSVKNKKKPGSVKPKTQEEPPTVMSGKRGTARKASDYVDMDARELLKEEGLSLFE